MSQSTPERVVEEPHAVVIGDAREETSSKTLARVEAHDAPIVQFEQMRTFAAHLVKTGFLPRAVDTPEKAVAIMLTGRELGLPPMRALRSIHIIQGKPTLAAELMLALFKAKGGRSQFRESTDRSATLWLRHPNGDEHEETFTIEDAERARLLNKDGWKNYPRAMLRARVISAGLRAVAPDVIGGVYDPEELGADVTLAGDFIMPEHDASSYDGGYGGGGGYDSAPPDPISDAQAEFLHKLMKSHVWDEDERQRVRIWIAKGPTREQATERIDACKHELERRKRECKCEKCASGKASTPSSPPQEGEASDSFAETTGRKTATDEDDRRARQTGIFPEDDEAAAEERKAALCESIDALFNADPAVLDETTLRVWTGVYAGLKEHWDGSTVKDFEKVLQQIERGRLDRTDNDT